MKINSTAAKHIKKYCYIIGLLSFLIAFFACSQMLRHQEKEKKASGTYMAQSTIRRVKAKLDNYIMISDFLGNYIIDGSDMDENTFSELAEKIPNEEGVVKAHGKYSFYLIMQCMTYFYYTSLQSCRKLFIILAESFLLINSVNVFIA